MTTWYWVDEGKTRGPSSFEDLIAAFEKKQIESDTQVRHQLDNDWVDFQSALMHYRENGSKPYSTKIDLPRTSEQPFIPTPSITLGAAPDPRDLPAKTPDAELDEVVDFNGDGIIDLALVDGNVNGISDLGIVDKSLDESESTHHDASGGGILDLSLFDSDHIGFIDSAPMDTPAAGSFDLTDFDTNGVDLADGIIMNLVQDEVSDADCDHVLDTVGFENDATE